MSRREVALRPPQGEAKDFRSFPRRTFRAGSTWFRQHRDRDTPDRGAWFFASAPEGEVGEGRFDLTEPHGTCYLSSTLEGAVRELVGPESTARGWVDAPLLRGRVVSALRLDRDVRTADTTIQRAAVFRVTNEISTTVDYATTQAWARVWHSAGFGGVQALLRFTPGRTRGFAMFGVAGSPDPAWPGDPDPRDVRGEVERLGIDVVDVPGSADVTVIDPR